MESVNLNELVTTTDSNMLQLQFHDWLDSGNTSQPIVIALHDKLKYETHILNLKPGHHYSVYVQAKQTKDTGNGTLVAYSAWQSVNKTTSM